MRRWVVLGLLVLCVAVAVAGDNGRPERSEGRCTWVDAGNVWVVVGKGWVWGIAKSDGCWRPWTGEVVGWVMDRGVLKVVWWNEASGEVGWLGVNTGLDEVEVWMPVSWVRFKGKAGHEDVTRLARQVRIEIRRAGR